jgi:hypothetical protein
MSNAKQTYRRAYSAIRESQRHANWFRRLKQNKGLFNERRCLIAAGISYSNRDVPFSGWLAKDRLDFWLECRAALHISDIPF